MPSNVVRGVKPFPKILDVQQAVALRIFGQVRHRILTRHRRPPAIQLQLHQPRIGQPQEFIVARHAVVGLPLKIVIVIRELQAFLLDLLPHFVELLGIPLPVIQRQAR